MWCFVRKTGASWRIPNRICARSSTNTTLFLFVLRAFLSYTIHHCVRCDIDETNPALTFEIARQPKRASTSTHRMLRLALVIACAAGIFAQLQPGAPWPMFMGDLQHTGRSS
jgi:hypothetical protein